MIQQWELDNGAHVLLDSVPNTDTASIGFWFLHGPRDEHASAVVSPSQAPAPLGSGPRGASHYLEHLLFKGTRRRDAFAIARDIDRVGGMLNAFTEKEGSCFYITLPKAHIALAMDVLADMVFCSILDESELEKEKSVIINEILSALDNPDELAHELFLSQMWGDHPLAWKITGDVEDIQGSTREAIRRFYAERYGPANLVVTAAGGFEVDWMADLIREKIGAERGGLFVPDRMGPTSRTFWRHEASRFNQIQVYLGTAYDVPKGDHGPHYDALVFSNAVGESMSSRLFQEIREKQALCYAISCFRAIFTDTALWTVYANTTPEQLPDLLRALDKELERVLAHPLTETEIEDAKSHLEGSLILAKSDMEVRMKRLARLHSLALDVIEYGESLTYIKGVSARGVRDITERIVRPGSFGLAAYGGEEIKNFEDQRFSFT